MSRSSKPGSSVGWMRYAGLATQLIVSLLIAVYLGKWLDGYFAYERPVWIWVLPLLVLLGSLVKLIKDTSVRK